ncbi:MAG: CDP-glycerol glycerophosphotransferase family protein [Clostridia bacterium]|nr:CDP-glycerol glycerophosphotransferase family protein [Clostridia bacterium]
MKRVFYWIYAAVFAVLRIFPLKVNKAVFVSPHNESFCDSLGAVMDEMIKRDEFKIVQISCDALKISFKSSDSFFRSLGNAISFFTVKIYHLATAKYIFLNDNFMPMSKLKFRDEAVITQLWHAEGIFKRFGLFIDQPEQVRNAEKACNSKLSYVVCSSEAIAPVYAEAFGVEESRVLALGSARADYFIKTEDTARLRAEFDSKYPQCRGKKLVLYAPTFRDDPESDKRILESFDSETFNERFGSKYSLIVRLHPQVHSCKKTLDGVVDACDYPNVGELIKISDILITDYSSICMDFALMDKPVYFYAYDLEKYERDRAFFFDYESYVPGPVARDFQTLLNLINNNVADSYKKRMADFRTMNFGKQVGGSAERIVNRIVFNKSAAE